VSATLRIALPKGRLYQPAVSRFAAAGIQLDGDPGRRLLLPSNDPAIEFLVVKPFDVAVYVELGAADLGVTGTDVLRETEADVLEPLDRIAGIQNAERQVILAGLAEELAAEAADGLEDTLADADGAAEHDGGHCAGFGRAIGEEDPADDGGGMGIGVEVGDRA